MRVHKVTLKALEYQYCERAISRHDVYMTLVAHGLTEAKAYRTMREITK